MPTMLTGSDIAAGALEQNANTTHGMPAAVWATKPTRESYTQQLSRRLKMFNEIRPAIQLGKIRVSYQTMGLMRIEEQCKRCWAVAVFLLIIVVESTIALKLLRTVVLMMLIEDKECPGWCNSADRESNDLRSLTTMYTMEYELINNHIDLYLFFICLEKSLSSSFFNSCNGRQSYLGIEEKLPTSSIHVSQIR